MTRWTGVAALSLAVMVGACGGAGDADMEAEGTEPADTQAAEMDVTVASTPACEPSDRMEVQGRTSPYDSATLSLGDGVAKVCYGRPSLRGRTMIGGEAVPYGQLWRTGANEPTTVHLTVPATIAGLEVQPGSYSLYTIPQEGEEWTLIVNRATSQWGHESSYTDEVEAQEVGRAPVHVDMTEGSTEQLTIRPMDDGSGLVLEWQNSRVHIPISTADGA